MNRSLAALALAIASLSCGEPSSHRAVGSEAFASSRKTDLMPLAHRLEIGVFQGRSRAASETTESLKGNAISEPRFRAWRLT